MYHWRTRRWSLVLGALSFLSLGIASSVVYADGGAPNLAYISGTPNGITALDIAQQRGTRMFAIAGDPHMILLSLDGRSLYVTQPQKGQVMILAAGTGETICTVSLPGQPSLLALDTVSNTLFTAGNGAALVSALDPSTCRIKRQFHTRGPVHGLAVAIVASGSADTQLWVADTTSLTVFNEANGKQLGQVSIPGGPEALSIPPGATVYATTRRGEVLAVDLKLQHVVALLSGGQYGPMDYDAFTGEVYVPDLKNGRLVVLAPVIPGFPPPKQPSRTIAVGGTPKAVAITSDGQLAFVALADGTISMLDVPARHVVAVIHVGGSPHFIITGLYPPVTKTATQPPLAWWRANMGIIASVVVLTLLVVLWMLFGQPGRRRASEHWRVANQANPSAKMSVTACPASESSASEWARNPPLTSAATMRSEGEPQRLLSHAYDHVRTLRAYCGFLQLPRGARAIE